jgi:tetratricopeptide (TPR) repeat protein
MVEAVLAKKKDHPLASYVKARLFLAAGDEDAARTVLEGALKESAEPKVYQALGRIYFESKDFGKAADIFELARECEQYESKWLAELTRIYTQTGDKEKLIQILEKLIPADADDLDSRKRLARMLVEAGRFVEAERYARQALEIDVLELDAQQALGDALLGQKKYGKAIETYTMLLEINDRVDAARLKLAQAYQATGSKEKARAEVEKVLARDPANGEAKQLQQMLDQ